jgi:protein kinase A
MKTYTNCGTPIYLAPEMLNGSGASFEIDIWSFGVLLTEIVSGKTPFYDESPMKTYENVVYCRPKYMKSITSELRDLLNSIFNLDPGSRISID